MNADMADNTIEVLWANRRIELPKRNDGILEMLAEAPWWMSVAVACLVFVTLRFILPGMMSSYSGLARLASSLAIWVALFLLIPGGMSALQAFKRGELLKGQTSISTIRNLSWRGLEELVGEAYRQQGYAVTGTPVGEPTGALIYWHARMARRYLYSASNGKPERSG